MKYLIFDTETGGFDENKHALMSVGALLLDEKLEEMSSFYTLLRNDRQLSISEEAVKVNGISENMLENALPHQVFNKIWLQLMLEVEVIIGHNLVFDIRIMKANGFYVPDKTLDTMHLSWDVWQYQKAQLGECFKRIGKEPLDAHNALYDCKMTLEVLRWFVEQKHISLPLPSYKLVEDYYSHKAFGYGKMKMLGLL